VTLPVCLRYRMNDSGSRCRIRTSDIRVCTSLKFTMYGSRGSVAIDRLDSAEMPARSLRCLKWKCPRGTLLPSALGGEGARGWRSPWLNARRCPGRWSPGTGTGPSGPRGRSWTNCVPSPGGTGTTLARPSGGRRAARSRVAGRPRVHRSTATTSSHRCGGSGPCWTPPPASVWPRSWPRRWRPWSGPASSTWTRPSGSSCSGSRRPRSTGCWPRSDGACR
jgi:hypothetical protein